MQLFAILYYFNILLKKNTIMSKCVLCQKAQLSSCSAVEVQNLCASALCSVLCSKCWGYDHDHSRQNCLYSSRKTQKQRSVTCFSCCFQKCTIHLIIRGLPGAFILLLWEQQLNFMPLGKEESFFEKQPWFRQQ